MVCFLVKPSTNKLLRNVCKSAKGFNPSLRRRGVWSCQMCSASLTYVRALITPLSAFLPAKWAGTMAGLFARWRHITEFIVPPYMDSEKLIPSYAKLGKDTSENADLSEVHVVLWPRDN